jgi:hypothetical protein
VFSLHLLDTPIVLYTDECICISTCTVGSAVPCPPFGDPHDKCVATREANQAEADYTAANGSNWVAAEEADANYQYENVEEADTTEYNGQDTASGGGFANASKGFQFWMIATMGSVLGAMIAIHIGQKKNRPNGQGHEMSGAVARRMGAVSAFAEGAFPCATKEQMGVEMQGQEVETGYQLEVGPEGVETRPGFAMV